MKIPGPQPAFYASAIIVKVGDDAPDTFELDIEVASDWFSTTVIPPGMLLDIRSIANRSGAAEASFDCVIKASGNTMKFLVDGDTRLRDEWSFC